MKKSYAAHAWTAPDFQGFGRVRHFIKSYKSMRFYENFIRFYKTTEASSFIPAFVDFLTSRAFTGVPTGNIFKTIEKL